MIQQEQGICSPGTGVRAAHYLCSQKSESFVCKDLRNITHLLLEKNLNDLFNQTALINQCLLCSLQIKRLIIVVPGDQSSPIFGLRKSKQDILM